MPEDDSGEVVLPFHRGSRTQLLGGSRRQYLRATSLAPSPSRRFTLLIFSSAVPCVQGLVLCAVALSYLKGQQQREQVKTLNVMASVTKV